MTAETPTVFVVDDDADVRRALDRLFRSAGLKAETFASAREFLERDARGPGCLVLDVRMPQLSGLDLQAELVARQIHTPIVFLSGHGDVPMTVRAMKGGAVDFLTKPFHSKDLLAVVRAALEKDRAQQATDAEQAALQLRVASLTERELEVFRWVVAGLLNKQIAAELSICERTVKVHRSRVMRKMQAVSVAELTRLAERGGIQIPAAGGDGVSPPPEARPRVAAPLP